MRYYSTGNTVAYENPLPEPEENEEEEEEAKDVRDYPCHGRCVLHIQNTAG